MYFTGYHGTTAARAEAILKEKSFHLSNGNTEWLGTGIYFYRDFSDALEWSEDAAVLHAVISVQADEALDLDSEIGTAIYKSVVDSILFDFGYLLSGTAQENQCAVAKFIWQEYNEINIIFASFASEPSKVRLLRDPRPKRREFCVRSNQCINSIQKIEVVIE